MRALLYNSEVRCAISISVAILIAVTWSASPSADRTQRDAGRLNAFWCPMHPEIRSPDPGRCPLCSMELVRIPPVAHGAYELAVTQIARDSGKGTQGLRIQIRHPTTAQPVTAFADVHERTLHLFIIGRDLAYFAHLHPVKTDRGFELPVALDPGAYVLVADFVPADGAPQLVQRAIVTPGSDASPFATHEVKPDHSDKVVDGIRISLAAAVKPQRESVLRFTLRDHASGEALTDLEPYLGAAGHLMIVNPDLTVAIHGHPEGQTTAGPDVVFAPVFPGPGLYKLWAQFQRQGKVVTAPFVVEVR
jgi:hypothetical protein